MGHVGLTSKKKKKQQRDLKKRGRRSAESSVEGEGNFIYLFSLTSLFDIWKSDRRNSSGQERKVLYSTRATCEYQKQGISPRF